MNNQFLDDMYYKDEYKPDKRLWIELADSNIKPELWNEIYLKLTERTTNAKN